MFNMANQLLVPMDKSDQAKLAFEFAIREFPDSTITLLHVLDPPATGYRTGKERGAQSPQSAFKQEVADEIAFLEDHVATAEAAGVTVTVDHAVAYERGKEARAIVDYGEDHNIDHIVMGSHGRTGVSRILLGSVAEEVVRRSPIPVTVVR